jgi:hypothetical protein
MVKELTLEESVIYGSNNSCTGDVTDYSKPYVVRGVVKKDHMMTCKNNNRDFYYIDTGYVGNFPSVGNSSGKKIWHRIVKNDVQHCSTISQPADRWNALVKQDPRLRWTGWKNYNKKILLVLPNPIATRYYDVDCETWIKETTEQIKQYSDLPIEIREKGSRSYRNLEYSVYDAFDSGVYATVAFNSIAALESVLYGIPAFVSVPCAATPLTDNNLANLSNPFRPDADTILNHCHSIAYGQFTQEEIINGTAWKILQKR